VPARTGLLDNRSKLAGVGGIQSGRKSTYDPKNPQKSVEDQFEEMAEDHRILGYTLVARVNEDVQGASEYSKKLTREKWQWIMHTIQSQPIGLVHFYALNRATRRLAIFGAFMELCRKRNVLVVLGDRVYDPRDSRDAYYLSSQAVRDEGMVQETREASMRGIKYSARRGKPHGVELFGYKRIYRSGGRLERIEIVREEAWIVVGNRPARSRW
jgi:site-specific DNA recombinase